MRSVAKLRGQPSLFSSVSAEARISTDLPLRAVRKRANPVLHELDDLFERPCSKKGRSTLTLEYRFRASLLQILHLIRSERLLLELLNDTLHFIVCGRVRGSIDLRSFRSTPLARRRLALDPASNGSMERRSIDESANDAVSPNGFARSPSHIHFTSVGGQ